MPLIFCAVAIFLLCMPIIAAPLEAVSVLGAYDSPSKSCSETSTVIGSLKWSDRFIRAVAELRLLDISDVRESAVTIVNVDDTSILQKSTYSSVLSEYDQSTSSRKTTAVGSSEFRKANEAICATTMYNVADIETDRIDIVGAQKGARFFVHDVVFSNLTLRVQRSPSSYLGPLRCSFLVILHPLSQSLPPLQIIHP